MVCSFWQPYCILLVRMFTNRPRLAGWYPEPEAIHTAAYEASAAQDMSNTHAAGRLAQQLCMVDRVTCTPHHARDAHAAVGLHAHTAWDASTRDTRIVSCRRGTLCAMLMYLSPCC
jgi:hypothetical protein